MSNTIKTAVLLGVLSALLLAIGELLGGSNGLVIAFVLAVEENHVSWAHMYRMMFVAQVGFAAAYLIP